jgi:hypothetical protein
MIKTAVVATINRDGNPELGRVELHLMFDEAANKYRWYCEGEDTEVSESYIETAMLAAEDQWDSEKWNLRVESWRDAAELRMTDDAQVLEEYRDKLMYDWSEGEQHFRWVTISDNNELIDWAKNI